jgi:hypothetical protein
MARFLVSLGAPAGDPPGKGPDHPFRQALLRPAAPGGRARRSASPRTRELPLFGEDFCRVCLCGPETVLEGLPAHSSRPRTTNAPQPPTELVDD